MADKDSFLVEFSGSDIANLNRSNGGDTSFLPLFDNPDLKLIPTGLCTMITAYAKVGKTEFTTRCAMDWARSGLRVIIYTEESIVIWYNDQRVGISMDGQDNFVVVPALGSSFRGISSHMLSNKADVYIVDTTKVLGIEDDINTGEVSRALGFIIDVARTQDATLIFNHHHNKRFSSNTDDGRGLAGNHAFLAMVDVSLEIYKRAPDSMAKLEDNERYVKSMGRLIMGDSIIYKKTGITPQDLEFVTQVNGDVPPTKTAILEVFKKHDDWLTLKEVVTLVPMKTTLVTARDHINSLIAEKIITQDPPISSKGRTTRFKVL